MLPSWIAEVDYVGWATALCYGVFVPCFLAFLFAKQHVVMRKSKTFSIRAESEGHAVTLKMQMMSDTEHIQEWHVRVHMVKDHQAYFISKCSPYACEAMFVRKIVGMDVDHIVRYIYIEY